MEDTYLIVAHRKWHTLCKASLYCLTLLFPLQVLMLVAPMFLMLLLPRLMKSMDPEAQKVHCIHSYIHHYSP